MPLDMDKLEQLLKLLQLICSVIVEKIPEENSTEIQEFCQKVLSIQIPSNSSILEDISTESKQALTVLYSMVITFSLVGNIGVIVVFAKNKSFRGAVTIPILSLAISDLLVTTFCIPFTLVNILNKTWEMGEFSVFACKMVPYMQTVTLVASTYSLGCIAFERYMAVLHPLKSRSYQSTPRTLMILAIIWLAAVFFSIPNLIWYNLQDITSVMTSNDVYLSSGHSICVIDEGSKVAVTYYKWVILVVIYALSFFGMAYAYVRISYHLTVRKSPGDSNCQPEIIHVRTSRRVITMLVIVQVLFFISQTPSLLYEAIAMVIDIDVNSTTLNIRYYLQWLASCNTCHNPIVYTFLHEKFRKNFASLCCCYKPKSKVSPVSDTSTQDQNPTTSNKTPEDKVTPIKD